MLFQKIQNSLKILREKLDFRNPDLTYLDNPNNNTLTKYYLKYNLENNNSKQEMGIINIQSNSNYGCSNIILREL